MHRFRKILCPVSFDRSLLTAVAVAAALAQKDNATLCLLHVIYCNPTGEPAFDEAKAAAQERLEQISHHKLKAGTRYELLVAAGDATEEILQTATRLRTDLIVMATHGRTGLRRLALGTVAERVVREAMCPVLTIRPRTTGCEASRRRSRS
jgi:universal stress protein A